MKKQSFYLSSLIILLSLFSACTSPQQKLNKQIAEKENELYTDSSMVPDAAKAKDMVNLYLEYADKFPEDTTSAGYLFKAGDLSSKINETKQAIDIFSRMIEKYPDHNSTPFALFLQGFIYENQVGDPAKAKPYYEAFLKKYPDHPIAGDVSFSMENLGKTPEELIKEFESRLAAEGNAKSDSNTVPTSR